MRKLHGSIAAAAIGALSFMGSMRSASAATEYAMILLDATGSMTALAEDGVTTRWNFAVNKAQETVQYITESKDGWNYANNYGISIWTFKLDLATGASGAVQVWPRTATDCTDILTSYSNKPGTTTPKVDPISFCVFPGNSANYTYLKDPGGVLDTVVRSVGPTEDIAQNTPLAQSICQAVSEVALAGSAVQKTIVLESDGYENQTPLTDLCYGPTATVAADFAVNQAVSDWGYPLVGTDVSWQAKAIRRGVRANIGDPTQWVASPATGPMPNLAWKVTTLFTFYPPSTLTSLTASATQLSLRSMLLGSTLGDAHTEQVATASRTLSATGVTTAAAMATGTYSISDAELGLFRGLGKNNAKSSYSQIVYDVSKPAVYGVAHKITGDVDDSNCVDMADYKIIMQKDVWMHRAVQPNQLAIRADVNRDGWINKGDRATVINNWGKGCINNPGKPPVL